MAKIGKSPGKMSNAFNKETITCDLYCEKTATPHGVIKKPERLLSDSLEALHIGQSLGKIASRLALCYSLVTLDVIDIIIHLKHQSESKLKAGQKKKL